MKETLRIRYGFDLPDGSKKHIDLRFDPKNFRLTNEVPAEPPFWTELKFSQCANCPLSSDEHPHCPVGAAHGAGCRVAEGAGLVRYGGRDGDAGRTHGACGNLARSRP